MHLLVVRVVQVVIREQLVVQVRMVRAAVAEVLHLGRMQQVVVA